MLGSALIVVVVADGLGLDFTKAVEVELPCETAEFVVIKVLRYDVGGEEILRMMLFDMVLRERGMCV